VQVVYACNPSYSEGRDQDIRPAQAKKKKEEEDEEEEEEEEEKKIMLVIYMSPSPPSLLKIQTTLSVLPGKVIAASLSL
jgi:hypothetical protein